ncbi:MAG: carbohydrate ABC transporter permease [Chloroflexi bacterium SZAS-1]|nr:carbohydrate ABC transporter permease [Chloroflexi bacterium SZAS-1]
MSARAASKRRQELVGALFVNIMLALICLLWTIPTFGLLVSSFRDRDAITSSGWWTIFPHQEFIKASTISLPRTTAMDQPITIPELGVTVTDAQLQAGTPLPDGRSIKWESRRQRTIAVSTKQWTSNTNFTLDNYSSVLTGKTRNPDGTIQSDAGTDFSGPFLNSVAVAIPATVIPILIAAFAAYGFAWMRFPGRKILFTIIVALLVVPLQLALVPILRDYVGLKINGTFLAVWLAHTGFGLPLATYLLYNYISELPREILESAFIDGATPFTIFTRLILPLSAPALAAFAIFQFLWVWNDYLVALIFIGATPNVQVLTMLLANMVGTRGQDWHLLTAGAFISMLLPLVVFFSLQRFFVRGLMAGSVKG